MSFASGNSWNAAPLGKSSSFSGGSSGLFGNTQKPGGLFGNTTSTNQTTTSSTGLFGNSTSNANTNNTGGLFGNSNANTNANNTGGLFGNSNSSANTNSTGGLFGKSNASASTTGGLFGLNTGTSGGLFGSSNTNNNTTNNTGGLFGSKPATNTTTNTSTGGLFGNTNTNANTNSNTGGLFGNSGSNTNSNTGGLFGNSTNTNTTGGLFGGNTNNTSGGLLSNNATTNTGGLFGSNNTNSTTGGLFGSNTTNTGGLFGSNNTTNTGGLFGSNTTNSGGFGTTNASTAANPYSYGTLLSNIQSTSMPASITEDLFPKATSVAKPPKATSSLLSKLGQTFRLFRNPRSNNPFSSIKGLFTQPSHITKTTRPTIRSSHTQKFNRKSYRSTIDRGTGDIRKLVIKSKPLRYHLINADKVLNMRSKRIEVSDDVSDESDIEVEEKSQIVGENAVSHIDPDDIVANDGYWCSPSIRELSKLSYEELAVVENFIIGRKDYGQIAYNQPVDLSEVFYSASERNQLASSELFGKIFRFEHKVVLVYRDMPKPSIGQGLNVPATITIVSPPSPHVTVSDHIKRMQNITGMDFVTYDPITYQWVSRVKHFSIWGLIDEDSKIENKDKLKQAQKEQFDAENEAVAEYLRVYENDVYQQEFKRQKIGRLTLEIPGAWNFDDTIVEQARKEKSDLVKDEVSRHIVSSKGEPIADDVSDITVESDSDSVESMVFEEKRDLDYLKQLISTLPPDVDMKEIVDEKAYEPEVSDDMFDAIQRRPNIAVSDDWLVQLELANDLNSALIPATSGALTTRHINEVLFPQKLSNEQQAIAMDETPELDYEETHPQHITKLVYTLLGKTTVTARFNKYPRVESTRVKFEELLVNDDPTERHVLQLALVLFDEVEPEQKYSEKLAAHLLQKAQRRRLGQWIRSYNSAEIEQGLSSGDVLDKVFLHVCNYNLKEAITMAINSNNAHLSVLLTLLDSNDETVRQIAASQLDYWEVLGSLAYIPAAIVKVHRILAGDLDSIAESVPWNIALSLRVFYSDLSVEAIFRKLPESDDVFVALMRGWEDNTTLKRVQTSNTNIKIKWVVTTALGHPSDATTTQFGDFLAHIGLWKEAVFVYSHLTVDQGASENIRKVIIAHVTNTSEEEYLTQVLKVPRSLIHEAISIEKHRAADYWGECESLVTARLWEQAHDVIVTHLGPQVVITGAGRPGLLDLIGKFPQRGDTIPSWRQGAGIYSQFIRLSDLFAAGDAIEVSELDSLLTNIALAKESSYDVNVALKLVSKTIGDIALERGSQIPDLRAKVLALKLGENERTYFEKRLAVN